jgi:hypothetical protein
MENQEINLDPTIEQILRDWGIVEAIATPNIGKESHSPFI